MIGIYKIENKINGFVYIGQSKDIDYRFKCHKAELRHGYHFNTYLQRAWNKYGEKAFVFSVIEECAESELNDKETYWCNFYKPNVYNLGKTGNKNTMSEETRQKISNTLKGRKMPPELVEKNRLGHIGLKHKRTKEQIVKHQEKVKGRHLSPNTEFKKGYIMSQDTREKIRKTLKGRKMSKEWCEKISKAKMGHTVSLETRIKLSQKLKGRKYKVKQRKLGEFTELVAQFIKESEKVAGKGENE